MYKRIPEYQNKVWGFREFETQKDYIEFLKSKLKKLVITICMIQIFL
jgi:hypothetical protein